MTGYERWMEEQGGAGEAPEEKRRDLRIGHGAWTNRSPAGRDPASSSCAAVGMCFSPVKTVRLRPENSGETAAVRLLTP